MKHTFTNVDEFQAWQKQEEKSTRSLYVQHSASRMHELNRKIYYNCNRSEFFKNRGSHLRSLKVQGSSKSGHVCTAHLTLSEDTVTGKVTVSYCKHHTNHEQE